VTANTGGRRADAVRNEAAIVDGGCACRDLPRRDVLLTFRAGGTTHDDQGEVGNGLVDRRSRHAGVGALSDLMTLRSWTYKAVGDMRMQRRQRCGLVVKPQSDPTVGTPSPAAQGASTGHAVTRRPPMISRTSDCEHWQAVRSCAG
jgi:hypothetical protein